jgi:hypothetical protein
VHYDIEDEEMHEDATIYAFLEQLRLVTPTHLMDRI